MYCGYMARYHGSIVGVAMVSVATVDVAVSIAIAYVAIVSIAHPVLKLAGPRPHRRHHGARLVK